MAKAVVDPGELRRFAHDLKRFNNAVREQMTSLMGRMNELGETWRDQEHLKFVQEFDQIAAHVREQMAAGASA